MRPVDIKYGVSQPFAGMPTAGVIGNINASMDTVEYWVGRYGDYQPYGHAGADLETPVGTPVYASRGGTVIWCDWDVNLPGGPNDWYSRWFFYQHFGGRIVLIQHSSGELDAYAHLSAFKVKYGQVVQEGQLIALSGSSAGGVDGGVDPHLHVERIVDTNYTTGGGLIYGRSDPSVLWSTFKPLSTTTAKKGLFVTLTAAQEKLILDRITKYIDAPISSIPKKSAVATWATTVLRGGKKISALQELADAKTLAQKLQAENATLKTQIASLQTVPAPVVTEVAK